MAVFLDTNVFMYAVGGEHPYKAPCLSILERVSEGRLQATTSVEVIQELHFVYARRGRLQDALALGAEILRLIPDTLPITRDDILRSSDILSRHPEVSPRDALHAATALNQGIAAIVSADRHFDRVTEIRRRDPLEV